MCKSIFLLICVGILTSNFGNCAKLPDYFKKCSASSGANECIKDNITRNLKRIVENGDKSVKLSTLNPMKVKHINLQATPDLKIILQDVEFSGFDTTIVKDVKADLEKQTLVLELNFGRFQMIGKYDINGRILILPIVGTGNANLTAVNADVVYKVKMEVIDKGGKKYYKAINQPMTIIPKRLYYQLDNLFNGDKRLGTEMNRFLNDNWKEVYEEVNGAVSDTVRELITTVVNAFLTNIPLSEIADN